MRFFQEFTIYIKIYDWYILVFYKYSIQYVQFIQSWNQEFLRYNFQQVKNVFCDELDVESHLPDFWIQNSVVGFLFVFRSMFTWHNLCFSPPLETGRKGLLSWDRFFQIPLKVLRISQTRRHSDNNYLDKRNLCPLKIENIWALRFSTHHFRRKRLWWIFCKMLSTKSMLNKQSGYCVECCVAPDFCAIFKKIQIRQLQSMLKILS